MARKKRLKKASRSHESTFLKDPLESIAVHIGNFFDRATSNQLIDMALYAGLAYVGCDTFGWKPESALLGPVSLRMAQSANIVAGAAGVVGLAGMGVSRLAPSLFDDFADKVFSIFDIQPEVDAYMKRQYPMAQWDGVPGYNLHAAVSSVMPCPIIEGKENIAVLAMFGFAKGCVAYDLPPPTPPPEPPVAGWGAFYTDGLFICSKHFCGATECAMTPDQLAKQKAEHDATHAPPSNGVE